MRVSVLGCYGFIGSHILSQLVKSGINAIGIDRYDSIPPWRKETIPPEFKIIKGDLLDVSLIERDIQGVDMLIFACGNPSPTNSSFDLLFSEELRTLVNILGFIAIKSPNTRLIFISSGGTVYGPRATGHLCCEDESLEPISMYGVMKLAAEKTIGSYSAQYGLKSIILRLANPYGIGQNPNGSQGLIPVVLKKLFLGEKISVWGSGDIFRDYFFVEDLSKLIMQILQNNQATGIYNVGSGKATSTIEIINHAADIANCKPIIDYLEARPQDLKWNTLSIDKTCKQFKWRPEVDLKEGMLRTSEWIRQLIDLKLI